jgi:small subunit ribosomal protein S6
VQGLYDLVLLLDPNAADERREEILRDVNSMIASGGSVVGQHDWGTRRMSFEIDHREEAAYHLFQFSGDAALLERLDHSLKIADGVLRFRTIGVKADQPPPPTPRSDGGRSEEDEDGSSSPSSRAPRSTADRR